MLPVPTPSSPFSVVTFIAAPALLTNATSVLALSTTNRMLASRTLMHNLFAESQAQHLTEDEKKRIVQQVSRVEKQGGLLLRSLHAVYTALAAFVASTLVTLLGVAAGPFNQMFLLHLLIGVGILLGFVGVGGMVVCCGNLFQATQISLLNMHDEAVYIRQRLFPSK